MILLGYFISDPEWGGMEVKNKNVKDIYAWMKGLPTVQVFSMPKERSLLISMIQL